MYVTVNRWLHVLWDMTFSILKPLTTEFFPQRQHIFMHSAHTTFNCRCSPQRPDLYGGVSTHGEPPLAVPIHDHPQAQQMEVKGGCELDSSL